MIAIKLSRKVLWLFNLLRNHQIDPRFEGQAFCSFHPRKPLHLPSTLCRKGYAGHGIDALTEVCSCSYTQLQRTITAIASSNSLENVCEEFLISCVVEEGIP